ncbi:MAG: hypothetical protein WCH57_04425 [Verrucomicrobiota bacterium]
MLFALLTDRRRITYRISFFLLLAFILVITGLVARTGCSHQDDMTWDTIFMLDGAYRLHSGQMPHVDYFSQIGVFPFWLISLGMSIGGVNANALAYGGALGFVFITLLAWFIAARRFSAFFSLSLSLLVGGLFIASRPMSFGLLNYLLEFSHASYAMWYNRVGWALLSLLAIQSFLSPHSREGSETVNDGEACIAGCLTFLLALTKVNYLAAALGIGLAGLCVTRPGWRRVFWYVAGMAFLPLVLWAFTRFSFRAYLGDLVTLGRLADTHDRLVRLVQLFVINLPDILCVGAVLWLLKPFCGGPHGAWREGGIGRLVVICGACVAIGLVVLTLDMQWHEIPLLAVACAVVWETAFRGSGAADAPSSEIVRVRLMGGAALFLFLFSGTFVNDGASIVYSWAFKNHMRYLTPDSGLIKSESLGSLLLPPQPGEQVEQPNVVRGLLTRRDFSPYMTGRVSLTPYQYAHLVNDGLALLRPHVTPASRIFCMDLMNPFPLALLLPPPKGGSLWWDRRTFSHQIFPSPQRVFGEVTHVMVPKIGLNGAEDLREVYGAYLTEHFSHASESALWDLYLKTARDRGDLTQSTGRE